MVESRPCRLETQDRRAELQLPHYRGIYHTLAHMFLQRRGHRKRHVTETAAINILADSSVCLHMSGQLGALRARV